MLMWDWKDDASGDGEMDQPSTTRARSPTFLSSGAGSATMSSVLLLLSLSKFVVIHDLSSCRQFTSSVGGSWHEEFVLI